MEENILLRKRTISKEMKDMKETKIKNSGQKKIKKSTKKSNKDRLEKEKEAVFKANRIAAIDPTYKGKSKLQVKASTVITALLGAVMGSYATVSIIQNSS